MLCDAHVLVAQWCKQGSIPTASIESSEEYLMPTLGLRSDLVTSTYNSKLPYPHMEADC